MSQIDITILRQGLKSRHVLACCFFTMADAYRDFSRYEKNLGNFLKQARALPEFEIRIYTDDTGKKSAMEHDAPNISVYHFNCAEMRDGDGHIGTFGTLVRFLPMFEDLDTVWISDIDIPSSFLNPDILDDMARNKCQVFYDTMLCHGERKVYGREYTIIAYRMIFKITFPKSMFTRYINKLIKNEMPDMINKLNDENTRKPPSRVPYGIDEVFMNQSIYDYLSRHSVPVLCNKSYLPGDGLLIQAQATKSERLLIGYSRGTRNRSDIAKIKNILKSRIPNILDKYPCLQELLDIIDKLPYTMEIRFKIKM